MTRLFPPFSSHFLLSYLCPIPTSTSSFSVSVIIFHLEWEAEEEEEEEVEDLGLDERLSELRTVQ